MRIIINAVLAFEKPRGVGRYLNCLIPELAEIDSENEYFIYYGSWMRGYDFLKVKKSNFHFIQLKISNNTLFRNLYLSYILPLKIKKIKPDLFFLPDTQALGIKPCKMIVSTIHDLMEFDYRDKYTKMRGLIRRHIVKKQARKSTHIITVSNFTKSEMCKILKIPNDKITVIYNSIDSDICALSNTNTHKYFLFVSETEKAKNALILLKAYNFLDASIKDEYEVKIVGKKGNQYNELVEYIKQNELENRISFYGYLSDEELRKMYAEAYVFVFPSMFEGFGLPVAEAMANGVPVICSNKASIPEVGGEAVLTFDPENAQELNDCLVKIINNKELRDNMIEKGLERVKIFSARKQAISTINVFKFVSRNGKSD